MNKKNEQEHIDSNNKNEKSDNKMKDAILKSKKLIEELQNDNNNLNNKIKEYDDVFADSISEIEQLKEDNANKELELANINKEKNKLEKELQRLKSEKRNTGNETESKAVGEAIVSAHALKEEIISQAKITAEKIESEAKENANKESKEIIDSATKRVEQQQNLYNLAKENLNNTLKDLKDLGLNINNIVSLSDGNKKNESSNNSWESVKVDKNKAGNLVALQEALKNGRAKK